MALRRISYSRVIPGIFDTLDNTASYDWEYHGYKHQHPAATSAGIYFQRKQVSGPCLLGEKLLGKTLHLCRYVTACVLAVGFEGSALYTRVHQMAILYIGMQTTYDLPGLWAGRDHLEMWQSGWSRCCFWLGLPSIVLFITERGKGLLKWSEECNQ